MPGGRPRGVTNCNADNGRIAARQYAEEALAIQAKIMRDAAAPAASRITAAENIMSRAYGKPAQAVELSGKNGNPIEHSVINDAERFTSTITSLIAREGTDETPKQTEH